jgi:hypothetical protein
MGLDKEEDEECNGDEENEGKEEEEEKGNDEFVEKLILVGVLGLSEGKEGNLNFFLFLSL